jgi:hypothetical protein
MTEKKEIFVREHEHGHEGAKGGIFEQGLVRI